MVKKKDVKVRWMDEQKVNECLSSFTLFMSTAIYSNCFTKSCDTGLPHLSLRSKTRLPKMYCMSVINNIKYSCEMTLHRLHYMKFNS